MHLLVESKDVYKDVNKNKRLDASDQFIFRIDEWGTKTIFSSKDTRYIAKVWTNHHATNNYQNYSITISTPKTLKLNVISASTAYHKRFDSTRFLGIVAGFPDFYVKTIIGVSGSRSKTIVNSNIPVFNYNHQYRLNPTDGDYPFSIDLYDSDFGSKDEHADINPSPNKKRLDLVYDVQDNQIRTDDGRVLGRPGKAITVKGNPGKHQASVTFIVR